MNCSRQCSQAISIVNKLCRNECCCATTIALPVHRLVSSFDAAVGIFAWISPGFISSTSLLTIAGALPDLTVVTVGMTLVLILGGIDLSVGSLLALSSSIFAVLMVRWQVPLFVSALIAIAISGSLGLCNGWISVQFRIPALSLRWAC